MNNFCELTVKFHCCGEIRTFTQPREFHMCNCGKCGFDAGDGAYTRTLSKDNFKDVEIIGYNIDRNTEYCKKYGLEYSAIEKCANKVGTPYYIKLESRSAVLMKHCADGSNEFLGTFSALKDARKRMDKLIQAELNNGI